MDKFTLPLENPPNTALRGHAQRTKSAFNYSLALLFVLFHIPLGLIVDGNPFLSTLHAVGTFFIGTFVALTSPKIERLVYGVAYITGAEVLWRMTNANVFHEFGKYAVALLSLISIAVVLLRQQEGLKSPGLLLLYFVLLLPSVFIILQDFSLSEAREKISFNLSGPLALFLCTWAFSNIEISLTQFKKMLIFFLAPVVAMATVATINLLSTSLFTFTGQSNRLLSVNVSPNQISSILGLGVCFTLIFLLIDNRRRFLFRTLMMVLFFSFIVLSALTFSRGGLYLAGAGLLIFVLSHFGERRRFQMIWMIIGIAIATQFVLVPFLENYTGGEFLRRFEDLTLSMRDRISQADLQIWKENPVFGVGPGGAVDYRRQLFSIRVSAHTEYTRVLAEHGLLGLISMLSLFFFILLLLRSHSRAPYKGVAFTAVVWMLLYIGINDMRLVAPAFMLGAAAIRITDPAEPKE